MGAIVGGKWREDRAGEGAERRSGCGWVGGRREAVPITPWAAVRGAGA